MTAIFTEFSPSQRVSLLVVATAVAMAGAAAAFVTLANLIIAG